MDKRKEAPAHPSACPTTPQGGPEYPPPSKQAPEDFFPACRSTELMPPVGLHLYEGRRRYTAGFRSHRPAPRKAPCRELTRFVKRFIWSPRCWCGPCCWG